MRSGESFYARVKTGRLMHFGVTHSSTRPIPGIAVRPQPAKNVATLCALAVPKREYIQRERERVDVH